MPKKTIINPKEGQIAHKAAICRERVQEGQKRETNRKADKQPDTKMKHMHEYLFYYENRKTYRYKKEGRDKKKK